MAFDGLFSVTQNASGTITLTDVSTGADATITTRQVRLIKYDGTTIVPSTNPAGQEWIDWELPMGDPLTLTDIFTMDWALRIRVDWITPTPTGGNSYTSSVLYVFTDFDETFYYGLIQELAAAKSNIDTSRNFMDNFFDLRLFIDSAEKAVAKGSDIYASQRCLSFAQKLVDNASFYFS